MKKQEKGQAKKMEKAAECIAFTNPKGGTGKTTSCLSIAGYLAKSGSKVLVVDFDPQANATSGLGIDTLTLKYSMYDALLDQCDGYEGVPITQVILETDVENLHVAPSELDLAVAEVLVQHTRNKAGILNRVLEKVRPLYDYILIDLPPGSGLLTINGLCASDQVVVPVDPSIFSLEALDNLKTSFRDIKRMAGHPINRITTVLIRYAKPDVFSRILHRRSPSREVEARLKTMFETVFVVPNSVEIYETHRQRVPISHYAPGSRVGRAYAEITKSISTSTEKKPDSSKFE